MLHINKRIVKHLLVLSCVALVFSCGKDDPASDDVQTDDDQIIIPPTGPLAELDFVKTYGGSGEDDATGFLQTNDGNFVILGSTRSTDGDLTGRTGDDSDFWLLKVSPTGEKIWSKTYGGTEDDKASKINKTSDGGYIVAGHSRSSDGDVSGNNGFHDYWILKLDAEGNLQWNKNFGFSGSDQAFEAFQTSDGGYFVTGFFDVSASGGDGNDATDNNGNDDSSRAGQHGVGEFWGIKLDATGNKQWRRYFGGSNNDRSYGALQTSDGGFLMVGQSESNDFDIIDDKGSYDMWAVRLTADGTKIWTKSFGGSEIDLGYALSKTPDGNYIMVGDSRSSDKDVTSPIGNADVWVVKFNDSGDLIWQHSYGGTQFDSARSVVPLSTGGFLLGGSTRSNDVDVTVNKGQNDVWAMIIDASGTLVSQNTVGGNLLDFGNEALQASDGKIYMVGNTESNNNGDIPLNRGIKDFLFIKFK